jgi:hypothetical protein
VIDTGNSNQLGEQDQLRLTAWPRMSGSITTSGLATPLQAQTVGLLVDVDKEHTLRRAIQLIRPSWRSEFLAGSAYRGPTQPRGRKPGSSIGG